MRIMAVDYGESRTGIAVCDPTEFLASPVCIIKEKNTLKAIEKIVEKAKELKAEQHAKDENMQDVALRFILLYIIQERATRIIARGWTTLEERRVLHEWHNCYHNGLHGNGDADALLAEVDRLRIVSDPAKEVALQCN